jgi:hypothetical protein
MISFPSPVGDERGLCGGETFRGDLLCGQAASVFDVGEVEWYDGGGRLFIAP